MASDDKKVYTIGSRKSQLALVQTHIVRDTLQSLYPEYEFKVEAMSTTGDRILDVALSKIGEKALFTKELEVALEDGRVDFVVHSLKDLPTTLPPGMFLGAVTEREDPNDALVLSPKWKGYSLASLPVGAVIGTSSLRRVAQLKRRYPSLVFKDVRGNLNTRLSKLDDPNGDYAGIILAVAGLVRLGHADRISQILPPNDSLHAVSQGALGIECRENDMHCRRLLEKLSHDATRIRCVSERALMRALEGGCSVPIGVNTLLKEDSLSLRGLVASVDGQTVVEHEEAISFTDANDVEAKVQLAEKLGNTVAQKLLDMGAGAILQEIHQKTAL
ncbi:porphobilinogen deaminase [Radiomyces spectabilis]|uniref:porphobilinogen deaminase n=1 Tax=Radiomyces spectabilis TaxID=64574 RepID=UPI00221FCBCC|nr:porphobilinogen deaminase [Radiomyces spectabilis]KAI8393760.1 porphobilinogen deaminase [Radiomyces spectabilis]